MIFGILSRKLLNFGSLIIRVPLGVKKAESGYFDLSNTAGLVVVLVDCVVKGSSLPGRPPDKSWPPVEDDGGEGTVGLTLPSSSFDI